MRKATLAVVIALCLTFAVGTATMAAPRVGSTGFDFGFTGVDGQTPNIGIGGFLDVNLALGEYMVLRLAVAKTFGEYGRGLSEFALQYNPTEYAGLYVGFLQMTCKNDWWVYPESRNGWPTYTERYLMPQAGLVLHLPVGENLSLFGLVSVHYEWDDRILVPGYGAYLTINFGSGFGVNAGLRGFFSELTLSPWVMTGVSYSF